MEKREFVIASRKQNELDSRRKEIENLFNVTVKFTSDPSTVSRTGNSWLRICGPEEENTVMAEEYVKSLCNAEHETILNIPRSFHSHLVSNQGNNLSKYQRKCGAVIVILSETELLIQGTQGAVERAERLITDEQGSSRIPSAALEYAKKLGYSDAEVLQALVKCGKNVSENALLHELLVLSSEKSFSIGSNETVEDSKDRFLLGNVITSTENCHKATGETKVHYMERETNEDVAGELRSIVIDGSNVAMCHGNKVSFSCLGIKICVNWFRNRGHKDITVFVPQWRKESCTSENPISNQEILFELEREKVVVFTPSRRVNGRRVICYDDRYIVKLAAITDGVIVSNDNFRDLGKENVTWKQVIDQRLLMYSFVNNMFMPPDDPQGRHGPNLDEFLKKGPWSQPRPCPYGKKCTYGQKCRFSHSERQPKPLNTDEEAEQSFSYASPTAASPNLTESQHRRHSFARPSAYSSCAKEYNNARSCLPSFNNDILARGSSCQPHPGVSRNQFNSEKSTVKEAPAQVSPTMPYFTGSEQSEYSSHYIPSMQGSSMVFYPSVYNPPASQPYIPNQAYIPAYYQYGASLPHHRPPQSYPIHGNQYVMAEQQQQHFFPQEGMSHVAPPPNLVNRVEQDQRNFSSSSVLVHDNGSCEANWVELLEHMEEIFPNKRDLILKVMKAHPHEADVSVLAQYILLNE